MNEEFNESIVYRWILYLLPFLISQTICEFDHEKKARFLRLFQTQPIFDYRHNNRSPIRGNNILSIETRVKGCK